MTDSSVVWRPNPGPQTWLLSCPVLDIFFGGARGGGKTDGMLGKWLTHANRYNQYARGIIFRRSMPELDDVIKRSRELFVPLGAFFKEQSKTWVFPNGAELRLRYLDRDADAAQYQGHEYTFMGFDEVGNWPSSAPIDMLRACLRSSHDVPCEMLSTGNPGGPGHDWVKARYIDPSPPLTPFVAGKITRVFIPSKLADNPRLSNPEQYTDNIRNSGPDWLVKAWLEGDWSGPPVGGIIDPNWLRTYVTQPPLGQIDIAADLAYRVTQKADFSAIGAFGSTAASEVTFLPGMVIDKIDTLQSVEAILDMAELHHANRLFAGKDMITGSIEPFLNKRMQERGVWLQVVEVSQHKDQLLRSQSFIARTKQGKILWPEGEQYRTVIHPQLVSYDGLGEQKDDIVAMAAHACMGLDMFSDYRAPKEPDWTNPDEKRWKELDRRKGKEENTTFQPLFGRSRRK